MRPAVETAKYPGLAGLVVHRLNGPFEAHRLTLDEMEYTTMSHLMKKLEDRWLKV